MLEVTVVNGNLRFVRQPLLLGHYRSAVLTGTECVMDELIGGAMEACLHMGHYPEAPGTHEVFINQRANGDNPLQLPRPRAVVVVGLGDEGSLRAADLARSVCQGVIAWAKREGETRDHPPATFELAATLLGSGGTGISAGQAASLVVDGIVEANRRLAGLGWPGVSRVQLIELYLDRATEAWQALRGRAGAEGFTVGDFVGAGAGALRRPSEGGYRGTRYDLVTATTVEGEHGEYSVSYVADTRRARSEVHARALQLPLLRDMVGRGSSDGNRDDSIGRTLLRLLVPVELEPFLAGSAETVIELDRGTAGVPWEMLDTSPSAEAEPRPWALSTRLVRKLRTVKFRPQVSDATRDDAVLIIGEPACDDPRYPRLPGARREAEVVTTMLRGCEELASTDVVGEYSPDAARPGPSARTVITRLLERDWRIVHITGHGATPVPTASSAESMPAPSRGVVLSGGIFLGAQEIRGMRVVPELVFVNCCHLAAPSGGELLREEGPGYDRPWIAASVAGELIDTGVRCVVAAGWAVEDEASYTFSTTFYERLISGDRFIDAVHAARTAAHRLGGHTWAAFQCYGDPDWTFRRERADTPRASAAPETLCANVASATALILTLENLAVNSAYDARAQKTLAGKLDQLEACFAERWGGKGAVAEAFGAAWVECDKAQAMEWYRRAVEANDGGASIRAAEQLGNLRARLAWAGAGSHDAARAEIREALALLEALADRVHGSVERESLCGSAWKRLAIVEAAAGCDVAEREAITAMKARYARAEALARSGGDVDLFYPALNRMAAELIVEGGDPAWPGFAKDDVDAVRENLRARATDDPDFWSVAGLAELELYEAIARGSLARDGASIAAQYADLHQRIGSGVKWATLHDQLRFVLPRYQARAPAAEIEAADAILALVAPFAA